MSLLVVVTIPPIFNIGKSFKECEGDLFVLIFFNRVIASLTIFSKAYTSICPLNKGILNFTCTLNGVSPLKWLFVEGTSSVCDSH